MPAHQDGHFFRPAPPADAGRQTTAETRTVGAVVARRLSEQVHSRKAPRAVLCTLPRFLSLGVICLLSAERKPSRPLGRAALAQAEIIQPVKQGQSPLKRHDKNHPHIIYIAY